MKYYNEVIEKEDHILVIVKQKEDNKIIGQYKIENKRETKPLMKKKNMFKVLRKELVSPTEIHCEIEINSKIIQFAKWIESDFVIDYEYLKGYNLLTEIEEEIVLNFIQDLPINNCQCKGEYL